MTNINPNTNVHHENGVGRLVKYAVKMGRKARKDLEFGICGEHGGDPDSIDFCERVGLHYVSYSPYRVTYSRLAAAQAAIRKQRRQDGDMGEES